jgi:hypothetical protein
MRSIPFILAAFAFSAPALAQSWEEYSYPEYAISVAFPTNPKIETTTYEIADGRSVRIPTKPATHSNMNPATCSDPKPAGVSDLMSATAGAAAGREE